MFHVYIECTLNKTVRPTRKLPDHMPSLIYILQVCNGKRNNLTYVEYTS
jgi:hypothetical protein